MSSITRLGAFAVFLISLVTYIMTIAPTTSFWDCGEFIACAYTMGIPHPPGAPFFNILGRIFTLMIPGLDIGLRVNLISAVTTALAVMVLFLIIARLIKEWRGDPETFEDYLIINAGAFIGSLSMAFSDTVWFNAVETEVYALSLLMTALVFWLVLLWMDYVKEFQSTRYLLLIIYIFSLGTSVHLLSWLVLPTIVLLMAFTHWRVLMRIDLWTIVPVIILIGLTCYLVPYIRSGLDPVIDQNNPENLTNFWAYLSRKQYGVESQLLTFMDRAAPFWEYQIQKMYIRYFGWQFIGHGTTIGPDNYVMETISFKGIYGLPFLVGLIGMFHHFKCDWKRALAVLVLFISTGIAIVIYLNQPDPQPRERDYVYVGSFMAFAIWIGMGMVAILENIFLAFHERMQTARIAAVTAIVGVIIISPLNLLAYNFESHNRSGNYVAWDYSYNILNSCDENALLFTNGDNDTFPLWYLQEVEGIRKDIRVVNLSLLNTNWYIEQLKYMEPKVPLTLNDEQIRNIQPQIWEAKRTMRMRVSPEQNKKYMSEVADQIPDESVDMIFDVPAAMKMQNLDIIRVQDMMILNIIAANRFKYPIYFAITVANNNRVGLDDYLRLDGMVYKLVTQKQMTMVPEIIEDRLFNKFQFRGLNDPDVYFNREITGLLQNYRTVYLQYVYYCLQNGNTEKTLEVLDHLEARIPESVIPVHNPDLSVQIGRLYAMAGRPEEMEKRLTMLLEEPNLSAQRITQLGELFFTQLRQFDKAEMQLQRALEKDPAHVRAFQLLYQLYESQKKYDKEIQLLETWLTVNPNDQGVQSRLNTLRNQMQSDTSGASAQ